MDSETIATTQSSGTIESRTRSSSNQEIETRLDEWKKDDGSS